MFLYNFNMKIGLALVMGYLFGSIPFAIIVSRIKGIDIRKVGSKNPGAANVFREVGKPYGLLVWALDMLKGIIPMWIARDFLNLHPFFVGLTGIAAVAGHCWSIFLRFKGGKGVATSGGVFLYLFPWFFPIAVVTYFAIQRAPRNPVVVISGFVFALGLALFIYRRFIHWALPFFIIFLIVGIIANREALREMRHENMGKKDI
ncbi:acyl-phosphate glycerol 3-phosphate acyltransferase [bacterium]|nr:MAG: acyl-phosphate glycerol 3-phosphate acyltransferase [bacterium]